MAILSLGPGSRSAGALKQHLPHAGEARGTRAPPGAPTAMTRWGGRERAAGSELTQGDELVGLVRLIDRARADDDASVCRPTQTVPPRCRRRPCRARCGRRATCASPTTSTRGRRVEARAARLGLEGDARPRMRPPASPARAARAHRPSPRPPGASTSSAASARNSNSNVQRSGTMLSAVPPCTTPVWRWCTARRRADRARPRAPGGRPCRGSSTISARRIFDRVDAHRARARSGRCARAR